ncbi:hypothetical protein [Fibrella arboris]|uniref:hypothetical protein n=1 Tax=Fibrella arboris TaxID=3242486 RepID=UPI0035214D2D
MKKRKIRYQKTRKFTAVLVACLLTLTQFCYAGNIAIDDSTTYKLFSRKIQLQASIGAASTNFSYPSIGYDNKYLHFIHADLYLIKKVSIRSDISLGLGYEPIGFILDSHLPTGESSHTKFRLFYGNVHMLYGYQLSKLGKHIDVRALTGIFGGRLIDNDVLSLVQPDNILYRSKNTTTYTSWNAGVSLGISGSKQIARKCALGLKIMYHIGISNTLSRESISRGGIDRYTRSIGLSTFINF